MRPLPPSSCPPLALRLKSPSQYILKMPWLSRRNSAEEDTKSDIFDETPVTMTSAAVTFVPTLVDGSCGTSPIHHREMTLRLVLNELKITVQNLRCLPAMARSTCSLDFARSLIRSWADFRDLCLQIALGVVELWGMMLAIPISLTLPGILFAPICAMFVGLVMALSWLLNREKVILSTSPSSSKEFSGEKWIYINSSMTRSASPSASLSLLPSG